MQDSSTVTPTAPQVQAAAERSLETRNRILTAARNSVLTNGLTRTSMVAIARKARVGRTTVYRNWPDLHTLLAEVLTRELLGLLDGAKSQTDKADTAEEVARLVVTIADDLRRSQVLQALIEHEAELMSTYVFKRFGTAQNAIIDIVRGRLDEAVAKDPRLAGRDATQLTVMLVYVVQGAVLSYRLGRNVVDERTWRTELERVVRGYLGL